MIIFSCLCLYPFHQTAISGARDLSRSFSGLIRKRSQRSTTHPKWNKSALIGRNLVEIEDQVQLAHIPEIFVQDLHERMDQLQDDQLVIIFIHNCDEIQARIALIYYLIIFVVNEIAHFGLPRDDQLINLKSTNCYLFEKSLLLHLRHVRRVPFREAGTSMPADQKEAMNHFLSIFILRFKLSFPCIWYQNI